MIDPRYTASVLASRQADLHEAPNAEVRACLLHELVLRGVAVPEKQLDDHPLAWLPLTRSDLEKDADLPGYNAHGGSAWSTPTAPTSGRTAVAGARGPSATETTADERTTTAVAEWAEKSNGMIEARSFVLGEPLEDELLPNLLLDLGLTCVEGAKPTFWVADSTPAHAWRVLFAAASFGGAYNSGMYGAYGRSAAWRSLAGLVGAGNSEGVAEVEARAGEWSWHWFDTHTAWFQDVAWDVALVAVSPDRTRVNVLAATDTD